MKVVQTLILADMGNKIAGSDWTGIHRDYTTAIQQIEHPPGAGKFILRGRVGKENRNGVVPIKTSFVQNILALRSGWQTEAPAGLVGHYGRVMDEGGDVGHKFIDYPSMKEVTVGVDSDPGDFDLYKELPGGQKAVIEWETGNVSSSHRSVNKLCMLLMERVIHFGILIVPSRDLYWHLTDRIGNFSELAPYLDFWAKAVSSSGEGVLALTVVEHDEITDKEVVSYLPRGTDGNSFRAKGGSRKGK